MEAFMEWFKAESMHVKGAPECMRVSGFMYGITNRYLIKRQNDNIPKSVDEMMSVTIAFLRGEVAMAHQSRKKGPPIWRHHEGSHKPSFDKRQDFKNRQKSSRRHDRFTLPTKTPKEILAVDTPWKQVMKQIATQSYFANQDISFPPLTSNDGQESPMVVEAEVGGHLIHRMYVDGGDGEHSTSALINFMVVRSPSPYNGIIGRPGLRNIQVVPSTVHEMLKFPTITIGGSLSEKGKMELCDLLKRNLDIFAWKPADMTGVPISIPEHRLNVREGCSPIRKQKRDQAPDQNKAI
ncbi:hypothetical protein Tco_0070887 [Tanacetum coccineum]